MPKSAQQKFNEYLDECRETTDAMMALESAARSRYGNHGGSHHAYVAGYFHIQLSDAISRLPKRQRAEFRENFRKATEKLEQEHLVLTIKEAV